MNKFAVVTGSTGGIGEQVAKRLAADNWNLILVNRSQSKAQAQIDSLSSSYPNQTFEAYQADFMDLASVQQAATDIAAAHESIHALYNIAGYMTNKLAHSAQGVESQLAVNALAPYVLTTALTESLAKGAGEADGAHVVNFSTSMISSVKKLDVANLASPAKVEGMGKTYAMAKLVVNIFNQASKDDLSKQNIAVLAVDPGPTKTPMTENMEGMPWIFKLLMPLMTKDVNQQTDKLMAGVKSAVAAKQTGLFISQGKVIKEHALATDGRLQQQVMELLNKLASI